MSSTFADLVGTPETTPYQRVFHSSDYAMFARALQRTRHLMGQPHTEKPEAMQVVVDNLTDAVAAVLAEDSQRGHGRFDDARFKAGTLIPEASTDEDDYDGDEDYDDEDDAPPYTPEF